ncbi:prisilkin-39-like [Dermacentor silvarum]|uniref:prisilkin-39-like n=1 Tax=Dermacentor silvarum TaxID=543639 RepID=UPI00210177C5|nr:prisilkin-39-like [Dermacentor silvarum]
MGPGAMVFNHSSGGTTITAHVLFACLVAKTYGLSHHQPAAGYQNPGYNGYAAPVGAAPYQGYADYAVPPQPYSFGYDTLDEFGNRQFRSEQSDSNNVKTGSYGYRDVNGLYRRVSYIADANGFRATVDTNEPGTAPGASADAVFNAAPVVPPVPAGAATPTAYGTRTAAPAYNGYGGYGQYGYDQYGRGAGGYGYGGNGLSGYAPNGLGGYAYGASSPYGYGAAGYTGGRYTPAAYGTRVAGHHGWRRRR